MNNQHPLMGVCVACGKSIMKGTKKAAPIDDFWTCSSDCLREYQEASAGWSAEKLLRVKQWQEQAVRDAMQQPDITDKNNATKTIPVVDTNRY